MDRTSTRTPKFGRVDPFCWVFVIPLFLVAVATVVAIDALVGIVMACVAIAVAVVDSWINRSAGRARQRR